MPDVPSPRSWNASFAAGAMPSQSALPGVPAHGFHAGAVLAAPEVSLRVTESAALPCPAGMRPSTHGEQTGQTHREVRLALHCMTGIVSLH